MSSPRRNRPYLPFLTVFLLLGAIGLGSLAFILLNQGASVPFRDVYRVQADFEAADGVIQGLGQPVNVSGVKVGQVVATELTDGRARLTLEIERGQVPEVHEDAAATLEPITPLKDMQVELDPGTPGSSVLAEDGLIALGRTNIPVELSELTSALDADTRTYMGSLIASLEEGTRGRATDMRRMLRALGPTMGQVKRINSALDRRRKELERLVTNLGLITREASRDDRLADVVLAGERTLSAMAEQDGPLRESIAKLPPTLELARSTLVNLEPFAKRAGPALDALRPAVRRLPATFEALDPLAEIGERALRREIRPLLREARPLVEQLSPLVGDLSSATPRLSRIFQVLTYTTNELAFNPEGDDDGFLFWLAWFMSNWNSMTSAADAHGGIGRATPLFNCEGLETVGELRPIFDTLDICPG